MSRTAPAITIDREAVEKAAAEHTRQMNRMVEAMLPDMRVPLPVEVLQARRNAEARYELLQEFGGLTSTQVGEFAGTKSSNRAALAHRWKSDGRIFSVVYRGVTYFPGFQFDAEGQPLPVMAEIIKIVGQVAKGWGVALWFTGANGWLGGKRPVDLLVKNPKKVLEAARHEAEELYF
ncbi:MAG TPA: hypothetical protein VEK57_12545 [Thermoanaerobaculia bacterium]|nr:hypothetical protein [Thermoanaerobaculia bacterium]